MRTIPRTIVLLVGWVFHTQQKRARQLRPKLIHFFSSFTFSILYMSGLHNTEGLHTEKANTIYTMYNRILFIITGEQTRTIYIYMIKLNCDICLILFSFSLQSMYFLLSYTIFSSSRSTQIASFAPLLFNFCFCCRLCHYWYFLINAQCSLATCGHSSHFDTRTRTHTQPNSLTHSLTHTHTHTHTHTQAHTQTNMRKYMHNYTHKHKSIRLNLYWLNL